MGLLAATVTQGATGMHDALNMQGQHATMPLAAPQPPAPHPPLPSRWHLPLLLAPPCHWPWVPQCLAGKLRRPLHQHRLVLRPLAKHRSLCVELVSPAGTPCAPKTTPKVTPPSQRTEHHQLGGLTVPLAHHIGGHTDVDAGITLAGAGHHQLPTADLPGARLSGGALISPKNTYLGGNPPFLTVRRLSLSLRRAPSFFQETLGSGWPRGGTHSRTAGSPAATTTSTGGCRKSSRSTGGDTGPQPCPSFPSPASVSLPLGL